MIPEQFIVLNPLDSFVGNISVYKFFAELGCFTFNSCFGEID